MSILSALKQQDGSIDDLAKLPQAMIMQMAQKKQISETMLAPILARKAELTDAIARTKAMQAGGQQPTVIEQLMQRNAEAEQPEPDAREMGIAANPIPERNYAGGGIVAFAQAGSVEDPNLPARQPGESDNAYMERVQALYNVGNEFFTPRNYNPLAKLSDLYGMYDRNIGQPFAEGVKRFTSESPEAQAAKFRSYAQQPKAAPEVATPAKTEKVEAKPKAGIESLVQRPATETKAGTKAQSPLEKATGAPEKTETTVDPIDAMLAKYEKMIAGDPEGSAKAKKEAMWSRLAEAGLGIMGGTSTNFAENVGKGATQAMKGYAEDVKGIRAADNEKLNQLAGLGLKGAALKQEARKLGITEKHYADWAKMEGLKIKEMAASRGDTARLRADTATDNRIVTLAGKLMTQPKYMENPELAYADAQRMVTGQSAQPTFAGFSGRSLTK